MLSSSSKQTTILKRSTSSSLFSPNHQPNKVTKKATNIQTVSQTNVDVWNPTWGSANISNINHIQRFQSKTLRPP